MTSWKKTGYDLNLEPEIIKNDWDMMKVGVRNFFHHKGLKPEVQICRIQHERT